MCSSSSIDLSGICNEGGSNAIKFQSNNLTISETEAQIYDRQIRLWGLEAQNRLRGSTVLIVGMGGLGAEVSKNLMLSGLKALTIMDNRNVTFEDSCSQFMIPPNSTKTNKAEASKTHLKQLNPMVELEVLTDSLNEMSEEFFCKFDLVILLDQLYETVCRVNRICRKNKIRFQAGAVYGHIGYAFFDFNNHLFLFPKVKEEPSLINECVIDDDENDEDIAEPPNKREKCSISVGKHILPAPVVTLDDEENATIRKHVQFQSFEQAMSVDLSSKRFSRRRFSIPSSYFVIRALVKMQSEEISVSLESLVENWKNELNSAKQNEASQSITKDDFELFIEPALNPVCAIVGSIIGQEAVKALSQNDIPLKSIFIYSTVEGSGLVCDLS